MNGGLNMEEPNDESTALITHPGGEGHQNRTCAVQIREVHHKFGSGTNENKVLHNNNLDIYSGEIVILTGKSGSGKTTLLTLLGGLRQIQKGSIQVWGQELSGMTPFELTEYRRRVGFIFQAHNLFGSLTAYQNVRLALELEPYTEQQIRERAVGLLTRLDLGERIDFKPSKLSGGQRQRVAIARALANSPQLILADEPTAALDERSARIVVDLLRELASERGSTIIIVTHDNKILDAADRIINISYEEIVSNNHVGRIQEICEFLKSSSRFAQRTPAELSEFASKMTDEAYPSGTTIFEENTQGDKFYLIQKGTVNVVVGQGENARCVATLSTGEYFGETALIYDRLRNATVITVTNVELYVLSKQDFAAALKASPSFDSQLRAALTLRE